MIINYDMARANEVHGDVTSLRLKSNAIAQVSELPNGDGFLIRVWPANGTHEYGGNNSTVVSLVVQDDEVTSLHLDRR